MRAKKTKENKSLNRKILDRHFFKNIHFDIENKEFEEFSTQDKTIYYKLLKNQG